MIISSRHSWPRVFLSKWQSKTSSQVFRLFLGHVVIFLQKRSYFFIKMGHSIGNGPNFRQKCPFCIKTGPKIMMDPSHHKVTTNINGSPFSCKVSRISRDFSLQVFKNRKILLMRSAFINASKITPCIKHGYGRPP